LKIPKPGKVRMEMWSKPIYMRAGLTQPDNEEVLSLAKRLWEKYPDPETLSFNALIERCRELVYDEQEGKPVFHCIAWSINAERLDLELSPLLDILITGGTTEEQSEEIRNTLAAALMAEVPVYPNTDALASVLAKHTRDLFVEGFTAPDGQGERVRLRLVNAPQPQSEILEYFKERSMTRQFSPAEVHLVREAALREIARRDQAARVLAQVELAVSELSSALVATRANERSLQRCLESNSILFGTEYVRIIPKHRLGSEYEMDFALERLDGLVDLVEIEASTRPLFTKAGDPSKYLVHAEQQALDWLEWVEHNSPYAREKLPGLATPIAFVVIGRSSSLDAVTAKRLRRRNVELGRRVRIQTYDDLLGGARNLLKMLEGKQ